MKSMKKKLVVAGIAMAFLLAALPAISGPKMATTAAPAPQDQRCSEGWFEEGQANCQSSESAAYLGACAKARETCTNTGGFPATNGCTELESGSNWCGYYSRVKICCVNLGFSAAVHTRARNK